jgi:hypothetical protein
VEHFGDRDAAIEKQLSRAASMSETIRYMPWAEPGAAAVTFLPKMIEQPEPGGVNWMPRQSSPLVIPVRVAIRALCRTASRGRHPRRADDDDLELHVNSRNAWFSLRSASLAGWVGVISGTPFCDLKERFTAASRLHTRVDGKGKSAIEAEILARTKRPVH